MCAHITRSLSLSLSVKAPPDKLSPSASEPTATNENKSREKRRSDESNFRIPKEEEEEEEKKKKKKKTTEQLAEDVLGDAGWRRRSGW